jgi:hypothetical protein
LDFGKLNSGLETALVTVLPDARRRGGAPDMRLHSGVGWLYVAASIGRSSRAALKET